jgi:uncharacterized protein
MTTESGAIYYGRVVHHRRRPRRHTLAYRVFSLLLDLDDLAASGSRLRLFSHNGFNLFSFHDRDHGPGDGTDLRTWLGRQLAAAGLDVDGGRIEVLCYPRILGYVFNPLTVYFCRRPDESLSAIVYEVNNTFGERHSYVIPVDAPAGAVVRQACDKRLYVSPFNDTHGGYRFRVTPPAGDVEVIVNYVDDAGLILHAGFRGARGPLTDRALITAFLRYPLMTVKVMAGIHWEALRLWRKGLRLVRRPAAPAESVTIVTPSGQTHPSTVNAPT